MAEIVSLNQYRKARARAKVETEASRNRVRFGRPKAEKNRDAAERERQANRQDGSRLERTEGPPDTD